MIRPQLRELTLDSLSLFLKGDGTGGFKAMKALESGLYIPGDVKDLNLISVAKENFILAAKNSDFLQFIKRN